MKWTEGQIEGVGVRPLKRFTDSRGWLAELVREDETPADVFPAMAYISVTHPDVQRGPHAHREQTDTFTFVGPGQFKIRMWDNRPDSPTHGARLTVSGGSASPLAITVPPGVVHAYRNVSAEEGWVLNFPNRLYAGRGHKGPVDEIRYEDLGATEFRMDD